MRTWHFSTFFCLEKMKLTSALWFNFTIMFFHQTRVAKRFVFGAIPTTNWIINERTALIARWPFIAGVPFCGGDSGSRSGWHRHGKNCYQNTNKMESNCNWIEPGLPTANENRRNFMLDTSRLKMISLAMRIVCYSRLNSIVNIARIALIFIWKHFFNASTVRRGGCECVTCRTLSAPAAVLSNIVWLTMTIAALHSPKSQMLLFFLPLITYSYSYNQKRVSICFRVCTQLFTFIAIVIVSTNYTSPFTDLPFYESLRMTIFTVQGVGWRTHCTSQRRALTTLLLTRTRSVRSVTLR